MFVLLWYLNVSFLIRLISISLEGSSYWESTVFRIPQAQISLHGAINSSGQRRNRLTQLKPIVQVQPPNGQLSQLSVF